MPRQSFGLNNLQSSFLCSCDSGACGTGEPVCHRRGPWGVAAAAGDAQGPPGQQVGPLLPPARL